MLDKAPKVCYIIYARLVAAPSGASYEWESMARGESRSA